MKISFTGLIVAGICISVAFIYGVTHLKEKIPAEDQEQIAEMAPEQIDNPIPIPKNKPAGKAELKQKPEAKHHTSQQRLGPAWDYLEFDDAMGRGKIKAVYTNSLNKVDFDFPYSGPQRATLQLRNHPAWGKDVILRIKKGQFLLCRRIRHCNIEIKFGDSRPTTFSTLHPEDGSSTTLFIEDYSRFVSKMKKVDRVYIEVQFYKEGNRVFEFDVSGFNGIEDRK